jgi:hypothetical protein
MTISAKSAVNRPEYPNPRQGARAVYNNGLPNKSVSRTRKGKCQTTPGGSQTAPLRIERHGSVLAFQFAFVPVSIVFVLRDHDCRLTLLTRTCQKRQNCRHTKLYIDARQHSRLTFLTPARQICQTAGDDEVFPFSPPLPAPPPA